MSTVVNAYRYLLLIEMICSSGKPYSSPSLDSLPAARTLLFILDELSELMRSLEDGLYITPYHDVVHD